MTNPAMPALRPYTLPEILDQAIRLYRNNFFKFIGILAIPYIPLILLQAVASFLTTSSLFNSMENPVASDNPFVALGAGYWIGILGMMVGVILQIVLVLAVATAALTRAAADNYLGQTISIMDSYRRMGNSWLRMLGAMVALFLIIFALMIWTVVPLVGWLTGFGAYFFIMTVISPLLTPIIVLEKHGIFASIRRAWDLSRSRFWWMLGFTLALALLNQVIVTGPTLLMRVIAEAAFGATTNMGLQANLVGTIVQSLTSMFMTLFYLPLQLSAMTVVYFDLRVRSEGLDLALQSAEANAIEDRASLLAEVAAPPQAALITGKEAGYFVLLSVIFTAIFGVFFICIMSVLVMAGSLASQY